jgi:hypothetical protein
MTKLVLVLSMLMLKLLAQPRSAGGVFRPVDPALFNNCGQVESGARQLAREIPDSSWSCIPEAKLSISRSLQNFGERLLPLIG